LESADDTVLNEFKLVEEGEVAKLHSDGLEEEEEEEEEDDDDGDIKFILSILDDIFLRR